MKKTISIVFLVVGVVLAGMAQIPERPAPPRLLNDYANLLNNDQNSKLEGALEQFARETSTQIVVVIVPDLGGYEKADYAFQLGEKWGVGQKDKDNGIVVLLKPKTPESKGEVFIATGYGLEAVLPDAILNRDIVDNEMIPSFMEGDYFGGLARGIQVIMEISKGEYTAEEYKQNAESGGGASFIVVILIVIFILSVFGRRRGRFYSPGRSLPFWLAMGMMSGRNSRGGSFGNFSSGSGSFGGFGGFGGGSFGGGGAGGSW